MKTKLFFGIAFVSALIFTGCKKYPDGPSFTLRTAKGRITNMWQLKESIVFHYGKTDTYGGHPDEVIDIKRDKTYVSTNTLGNTSGKWAFSSDKESMTLTEDGGDAITYKILELKSKEMKIKYEQSSDVYYEYHFEKK